MFRPRRVRFEMGDFPSAEAEPRSRNCSDTWPQSFDPLDQNQLRVPCDTTSQQFALSPPGTPLTAAGGLRRCSRIYCIPEQNMTPVPTPSLSRRSDAVNSGRQSTRSRLSISSESSVTPREIAVCIALLLFSAMHVCSQSKHFFILSNIFVLI